MVSDSGNDSENFSNQRNCGLRCENRIKKSVRQMPLNPTNRQDLRNSQQSSLQSSGKTDAGLKKQSMPALWMNTSAAWSIPLRQKEDK
jgi:hypothetical protein